MSGELHEFEKGTKVSFTFEPNKPYFNIDILIIAVLFLLFYQKDFPLAFFAVIVLLINVVFIESYHSSWVLLENQLIQNLKSWKRDS